MPVSEIIPRKDMNENGLPVSISPQLAPTSAIGTASRISTGCASDWKRSTRMM